MIYNDLPFFLERMKIEKVEKLEADLFEKTEYIVNIRNLKQSFNHGLVLKKVHKIIKFNDINTELKKSKNGFEKDFFKLMNNGVFGKKWKM